MGRVKRLEAKHPLAIRWFHWVNFPILFGMIYTGLMIYWASDTYRIGWGGFTLFHFFPDWFYRAFGLVHKLPVGMAWHFLLMWIFAINGVAYVAYTIVSGEWRWLVPTRHSFKEAIQVTLFDLGLSKYCPPAPRYNGAQRIAYTAIVLMGFGSLVTGLAIYKYVQFAWLAKLLLGYRAARYEHFLLTLGYCGFFVVHVAQVMRAGWNNFRSMVTGYAIVTDDEAPHAGRS
jgi:thiosulfate reductase cytochrome b subunit